MRQITLASFGVALGLTLVWSQAATASSFTPLKWQQDVKQHPIDAFIGQQKHATWSRDKNRSFIDDRIEHLFKSGQTVNVVVDLNESLSPAQITNLLSKFGKIKYIGKLVTFVVLDDVRFDDLFYIG